MIEDYIGNYDIVKTLNSWLEQWFDDFCTGEPKLEQKQYVILHGSSGNGKTFLIECFAKDYNKDLLRFTFEDFDNINNVEKSINLQDLESEQSKIVLFDDIEDIDKKKRKKLYKMYEISNYPVIYIVNSLDSLGKSDLDKEFKENGLTLELKRPLNHEIKGLLEKKAKELKLECKNIDSIAQESVSVRTALQGLLIDCTIEKRPPNINDYSLIKLMSNRALNEDISWFTLRTGFRNINIIDITSYRLMEEFCKLDYIVHVEHFKNKEILLDSMIFNNMDNIELVKPKEKKKKEVKKQKVKKIKEEKEEVIEEVKEIVKEVKSESQPASLNDFL